MSLAAYGKNILEALIPALILWGILVFSMWRDRSRYRNTVFLFFSLMSTIPLISTLFGPWQNAAFSVIMLVILLLIFCVPVIFIINGIQMIRKEGKRLQNLLSLFLGIIVAVGEICAVLSILLPYAGVFQSMTERGALKLSVFTMVLALIALSVVYGSLVFVSFIFYTMLLQIIPHKRDFDYVIIHGCGLIGGKQVSKLLSDRLDKAIALYRKDPTPPVMIPSGGQGSDEDISEASAMAQYLREHGIPDDHILMEDKSLTTFENLKYSKKLIDAQPGRKYTVLVTSNYHVYRALRYCRKIGLACTGVGAHVAAYYWPSALIREFAAIHREKKHMLLFIAGWVLMVFPIILILFDMI
ncbi:MAG: YdcF family protein [Bilifractor sp.]